MNETAVAEKLSKSTNTVHKIIAFSIIEQDVLINIFKLIIVILSCLSLFVISIAWLLYAERMLAQEAVSRVVSASPSTLC